MAIFNIGDRVKLNKATLWACTPLNINGDETPIEVGTVGVVVELFKDKEGFIVEWENPWFPSSEKVRYGFPKWTNKLDKIGTIADSIEHLRREIVIDMSREESALGVSHADIVALHHQERCTKILHRFADLQAEIAKTF